MRSSLSLSLRTAGSCHSEQGRNQHSHDKYSHSLPPLLANHRHHRRRRRHHYHHCRGQSEPGFKAGKGKGKGFKGQKSTVLEFATSSSEASPSDSCSASAAAAAAAAAASAAASSSALNFSTIANLGRCGVGGLAQERN